MNAGQMLLEGFTGLFKRVEDELSTLYDCFRRLKSRDATLENSDTQQDHKNLKVYFFDSFFFLSHNIDKKLGSWLIVCLD